MLLASERPAASPRDVASACGPDIWYSRAQVWKHYKAGKPGRLPLCLPCMRPFRAVPRHALQAMFRFATHLPAGML